MNILVENALLLTMSGEGAASKAAGAGASQAGGGPQGASTTQAAPQPATVGSVGITDGKIAMVSGDPAEAEAFRRKYAAGLKVISGRDRLVMPGLVNTHGHAPMSLMRSMADDLPLMEWLDRYIWPAEAKLTRERIVLGAQLAMAEMLLGGTTTFVDLYWMEEAVGEAAEAAGIRAVLCPTMIDFKKEAFERDAEAVFSRYAAGGSGGYAGGRSGSSASGRCPTISAMAGAHSPYSVSRENLLRVKELSEKYGVGIHIHLAETKDEARIIRERHNMSPVEYVDSLGLLTPSTLAVHCVHLSESDMEILARRGCSVAHNPQSNMKLGTGAAPVARMLAKGINVSLGTDGPASNNDLDMIEEMRTAAFLQKLATGDPLALPAWQALRMATSSGARAIGMGDELGRLEVGMRADVILLDTRKAHLYPEADMAANVVYAGKAADVDTVIVEGRVVVEGRRLLTLDLEAILERVAANR